MLAMWRVGNRAIETKLHASPPVSVLMISPATLAGTCGAQQWRCTARLPPPGGDSERCRATLRESVAASAAHRSIVAQTAAARNCPMALRRDLVRPELPRVILRSSAAQAVTSLDDLEHDCYTATGCKPLYLRYVTTCAWLMRLLCGAH